MATIPLTRREQQILAERATGAERKQIAARLDVSETTVNHHFQSISEKTGVGGDLALVHWAIRNGIVPADQYLDIVFDGAAIPGYRRDEDEGERDCPACMDMQTRAYRIHEHLAAAQALAAGIQAEVVADLAPGDDTPGVIDRAESESILKALAQLDATLARLRRSIECSRAISN